MKKRFFYVYIIMVCCLISACDVESSDNGALDGFWQLAYLEEGGERVDMRQSGITWAFQGELLELRDVTKVNQTFLLSFEHGSGTLRVYAPFFLDRDNDDIPVDNVNYLLPYGIRQLDERFSVVRLDGDAMILRSDHCLLEFRKY